MRYVVLFFRVIFYFHYYLCTIFFFTSRDTYQKLLHMYGYVCLFCHIIDSVLGEHINISGNVHFICSQCIKLYMYTVCTLLGIATFFLHTCFKDGLSLHIFIYKFWPRFKIFYRLARTFKTQMTSKNFKFGDLGDSSMNKFVRYRLSNFEQYLIYKIFQYNFNIVVYVWVVRL